MTYPCRTVSLIAFVALLSTGSAFTQAPSTEETSKLATAPTTVAYVYVQTNKGVNVYDATTAGKLALVKGSPFATVGQMGSINGKYLISVGTAFLRSYVIESNGAVGKQVSEINSQDYDGAECGNNTDAGTILDHTGKYLYVELDEDGGNCAAWQSYQIASNGEFTFIGDVLGTSYGDGNADPTNIPTFDSSDRYAYAPAWEESQPGFAPFVRSNSGDLMNNTVFRETDPTTDPNLDYFLAPIMARADSHEHLAVAMIPWLYGGNGSAPVNLKMASYTIDPATGSIASTNTEDNIPFAAMGGAPSAMSISYGGNFVAIGSGLRP